MSLGAVNADATFVLLATLFTLQLGLPLVLLGLLLSHLSTLLLLPLDVADVADVVVVDADAEAAAATESNDGGNVIEAIAVVEDVAIFDEEALRTQLSKLDTKVSSTVEPTVMLVLVDGDAALYSVAEVICLPISGIMAGNGDTDAEDAAATAGNGLPAMLVTAEELAVNEDDAAVMSCCCGCCCRNLLAGRDTTTKYRVLPARSDSSLTAILSVSSGRSR